MKKILMFLCLLFVGIAISACGGGGGGSSSGGGYGYIPAVTPNNPNDPNNPNNPNDPINPVNPAYQSVTLNDEVLQQLYELGIIETTDKAEFDKTKLTSINIPATYTCNGTKYQITAIADRLFYNCINLKTVYIPDTVSSIGDLAFWNVEHIYYNKAIPYNRYGWGALNVNNDKYKEVDLLSYNSNINESAIVQLSELGNYLPDKDKLATVHIPAIYIYDRTKYKIVSINKPYSNGNTSSINGYLTPQYMHLPASITYIGKQPFTGGTCSKLEGIDIPDSVSYMDEICFWQCSALKSIKIPNKVKTIKREAFYDCTSLQKVTIPDGVTTIEDGAFWHCISLKHIDIPDSVTTIGEESGYQGTYHYGLGAFEKCTQLESVKLSSNLQNLSNATFCESGLKSITIPKSVITISNHVFYCCKSLKSVKIEEGSKLTTIGFLSFAGCNALESINIPNGVTTIEDGAFYNCTSLILEIPDSVVNIYAYAYYPAFEGVLHIYYTGIATGAPWGAKAIN